MMPSLASGPTSTVTNSTLPISSTVSGLLSGKTRAFEDGMPAHDPDLSFSLDRALQPPLRGRGP